MSKPAKRFPSIEQTLAERLSVRRRDALAAAKRALDLLERKGVQAGIFGSLATGKFSLASDVDILVLSCPEDLRYSIETEIGEVMHGFSFDVAYLDEVAEPARTRALSEVRRASDLR